MQSSKWLGSVELSVKGRGKRFKGQICTSANSTGMTATAFTHTEMAHSRKEVTLIEVPEIPFRTRSIRHPLSIQPFYQWTELWHSPCQHVELVAAMPATYTPRIEPLKEYGERRRRSSRVTELFY